MINGNSHDSLTLQGIHSLFNENFEGQQFFLQVIDVDQSKYQDTSLTLSDGYTYLKGYLQGQAKIRLAQGPAFKLFSVIKFQLEDVRIEHSPPCFRLANFQLFNIRIVKQIGDPISYAQYLSKKMFEVSKKVFNLGDFDIVSISKVKEMKMGRLAATIRAKVLSKPNKINSFMNIQIEDQYGSTIQVVFFKQMVDKYKDMIQEGSWYRFEDPTLQSHNKSNQLQLKIVEKSNIVKLTNLEGRPGYINAHDKSSKQYIPSKQTSKQEKPADNPQNLNFSKQTSKSQDSDPFSVTYKGPQIKSMGKFQFRQPEDDYLKRSQFQSYTQIKPKPQKNQKPMVEFDPNEYTVDGIYEARCFVVAKVYKMSMLRNEIGRSFTAKDRNGNSIEILLWKDVTDSVQIGNTYMFGPMKVKIYKGQATLQSIKYNTKVEQNEDLDIQQLDQNCFEARLKKLQLKQDQKVYSLQSMIVQAQTSSQKVLYFYAFGYLMIKLLPFSSSPDFKMETLRKIFYAKCSHCQTSPMGRQNTQPKVDNQRILCCTCQRQVQVMWNIKCFLIDQEIQLPVKLNSQITQLLLDCKPQAGMKMYLEDYSSFRQTLLARLNLQRAVFKVNAKMKDIRNNDRYYNVLEVYGDTQQLWEQRIEAQEAITMQAQIQNEKTKEKMKEKGRKGWERMDVIYEDQPYDYQ